MPRLPSITASVKSLAIEPFCKPSSITTTLAPFARANSAPATRSRAMMVGAARASSNASSPTCAAVSACTSTSFGPARLPP